MGHHFSLKEWQTDKLWLFGLGYLSDIFPKINKPPKQMTVFMLPKIRLEFLRVN